MGISLEILRTQIQTLMLTAFLAFTEHFSLLRMEIHTITHMQLK